MTPIDRTTPIEHLPELLRVAEVAAWLGKSEWMVYDLARRNILPSVRLGRSVLITRQALAHLVGRELDHAAGG
jgi:excisionase family DNA binding protein